MSIAAKYFLEKTEINVNNIIISIFQSQTFDKYFDSMSRDEIELIKEIPYFINVWNSGYYLSVFFAKNYGKEKITGKKILELGSGCGLTGILLSLLGGNVVFSDYLSDSLSLCRENAKLNNICEITAIQADWNDFPEINDDIDMVIGADLLYEDKLLLPFFNTIERFLEKRIPVIISDPQRYNLNKFLQLIEYHGYKITLLSQSDDSIPIKIYQII